MNNSGSSIYRTIYTTIQRGLWKLKLSKPRIFYLSIASNIRFSGWTGLQRLWTLQEVGNYALNWICAHLSDSIWSLSSGMSCVKLAVYTPLFLFVTNTLDTKRVERANNSILCEKGTQVRVFLQIDVVVYDQSAIKTCDVYTLDRCWDWFCTVAQKIVVTTWQICFIKFLICRKEMCPSSEVRNLSRSYYSIFVEAVFSRKLSC